MLVVANLMNAWVVLVVASLASVAAAAAGEDSVVATRGGLRSLGKTKKNLLKLEGVNIVSCTSLSHYPMLHSYGGTTCSNTDTGGVIQIDAERLADEQFTGDIVDHFLRPNVYNIDVLNSSNVFANYMDSGSIYPNDQNHQMSFVDVMNITLFNFLLQPVGVKEVQLRSLHIGQGSIRKGRSWIGKEEIIHNWWIGGQGCERIEGHRMLTCPTVNDDGFVLFVGRHDDTVEVFWTQERVKAT
jgi:hypothetical protein